MKTWLFETFLVMMGCYFIKETQGGTYPGGWGLVHVMIINDWRERQQPWSEAARSYVPVP